VLNRSHPSIPPDNGEVYIWGLGGEKEISVPLLPKTVLPLRKISVQLIATGGSHCLALGSKSLIVRLHDISRARGNVSRVSILHHTGRSRTLQQLLNG